MATLSDIHLNLKYDPNVIYDKQNRIFCEQNAEGTNPLDDEVANLGRYGCDTPIELLERMLQTMRKKNPKLDVLFLPGDMIGHGYP